VTEFVVGLARMMPIPARLRHLLTATVPVALLAALAGASAAGPKPEGPEAGSAPIHGNVALYTLTPEGDVDDFVLGDGAEVHIAPHQGTALVFTARPGDTVTVQGHRSKDGPMVEATELRNRISGVDLAAGGSTHGLEGPDAGPGRIDGKVPFTLHGPRGEINGAMLEDGITLWLAPRAAVKQAALLDQLDR
jgi:hypothetical protein